ncbi:MAG: ATP-binding protein [Candidatus Treponema excrementipullorum]|nr:ATP-binding protein [Candidatus Treponema excrementipullorum]MDY4708226.1 ATP-binding protein [Candidatus Treponema excrementipullorum]
MEDISLYSVKQGSQQELTAILLYVYNMCGDIDDYKDLGALQNLFMALVRAFRKEAHLRKVMEAIIENHKTHKLLTVKHRCSEEEAGKPLHPFEYPGTIKENFLEDPVIFHRAQGWKTDSADSINLVRCMFAEEYADFSSLLLYTLQINVKTFGHDFLKNTDKVRFLVDRFSLTETEAKLIYCGYLFHAVRELNRLFVSLVQKGKSPISIYAHSLGLSVTTIKSVLKEKGRLCSFYFFDTEGNMAEDLIDCIYEGNADILFACIRDRATLEESSTEALKKDTLRDKNQELKDFTVPEEESRAAIELLQNLESPQFLLYGTNDYEKITWAKAVVRKAGFIPEVFSTLWSSCLEDVSQEDVSQEDVSQESDAQTVPPEESCATELSSGKLMRGRLKALLSVQKKNTVFIIDLLEQSFFSGNFMELRENSKKMVERNDFLYTLLQNPNKVMWVVNYSHLWEPPILARFDFSRSFEEPDRDTLCRIADSKLKNLTISESLHKELVELCGTYYVSERALDTMVETIKHMPPEKSEKTIKSTIEKIFEAQSNLLAPSTPQSTVRGLKKNYTLSVLNTSVPAEEILSMVKNAQNFSEEEGIRLLFHGASGTGKTELARYIGDALGKEVCLKRVSDILGPRVGESEQHMAEAFREAESKGNILLLDEADSFFADRKNAFNNWEITLVNELLSQMEDFKGILICTTNFRESMDVAMERRFHIICEFNPLTKEGIETLLARFFPAYTFEKGQIEKLCRYTTVTPGDFGIFASKLRFMNPAEITAGFIVQQLCKLQEEKKGTVHTVGFLA